MIRRFTHSRPMLTVTFILLWTFHFSFGMFTHYHPEYVHAHDGELQAHKHGGHFHSLELDTLVHFIDSGEQPLRPGETHHHSENMPGSDAETAQYDLNHSGITKVKPALEFHPHATVVSSIPVQLEHSHSQQVSSDSNRILLSPYNHPERSPPLRV